MKRRKGRRERGWKVEKGKKCEGEEANAECRKDKRAGKK
jgi:hypothetical protein